MLRSAAALAVFAAWGVPARAAGDFDPRKYGAIGDGRSHPIGRAYGNSPAAAAAWAKAGEHPFIWMADPRYGLIFSMAPSAPQTRRGDTATFLVTIPTAFGQQSFAQFNADPGNSQKQITPGWLVSGPSIAAGTTVSRFDVAAGTITFSKPTTAALTAGAALSFTIPPDAFTALEMDYVGTQSAMAAAVRAHGATVSVSAGDYLWNHAVWNPGVTDGTSLQGNANLVGADTASVRFRVTTDTGRVAAR